jgi:hypothetical protein
VIGPKEKTPTADGAAEITLSAKGSPSLQWLNSFRARLESRLFQSASLFVLNVYVYLCLFFPGMSLFKSLWPIVGSVECRLPASVEGYERKIA